MNELLCLLVFWTVLSIMFPLGLLGKAMIFTGTVLVHICELVIDTTEYLLERFAPT